MAAAFVVVTAGGMVWQQATFETHVGDYEKESDRRFDELEKDTRLLLESRTDIAVLSNSMEHVEEMVDRLGNRVDLVLDELRAR